MWYVEPLSQSLLSVSRTPTAKAPCPSAPPRAPCPPCSGARRDEEGFFTTWPSLSCPYDKAPHPAHSGGTGPPLPPGLYASPHPAAQLFKEASLGGGGWSCPHLGNSGCSATGCTHIHAEQEVPASRPPTPTLPVPTPAQPSPRLQQLIPQGAQEVAAAAPGTQVRNQRDFLRLSSPHDGEGPSAQRQGRHQKTPTPCH